MRQIDSHQGRTLWRQERPAIFLDRDGTLLRDAHYDSTEQGVPLVPGAARAVRRFRDHGFRVVVVSNQSGIAAGLYTHSDVARIHTVLSAKLAREGAFVDGFFYCDHAPDEDCTCRKPATGLIEAAIRTLRIRRAGSYMVGDRLSDLLAGRRAGLHTALVQTGLGASVTDLEAADLVVADLAELAERLLGLDSDPGGG